MQTVLSLRSLIRSYQGPHCFYRVFKNNKIRTADDKADDLIRMPMKMLNTVLLSSYLITSEIVVIALFIHTYHAARIQSGNRGLDQKSQIYNVP